MICRYFNLLKIPMVNLKQIKKNHILFSLNISWNMTILLHQREITPIKVFENELFYNLDVQMVKPRVHYNGTTYEYLFVMLELDK